MRTLIFTLIVPGTVAVYVPVWLVASRPAHLPVELGLFRFLGLPLILIGVLLYSWCAWDFTFAGRGTPAPVDPPKELVVHGLYRYVRNPMYVGVSLVLLRESLLFESRILLEYWGVVFLLFHAFVVFYEELSLKTKFGLSYDRY